MWAIGMEDYMALEVHKGFYKLMLANLWSYGRIFEEVCFGYYSSIDCITLFQISRELMDLNLKVYSKMSTVLEWLTPLIK